MDARQIIIILLIIGFFFLSSSSQKKKKRMEEEAEALKRQKQREALLQEEEIEADENNRRFERKHANYSKIEEMGSLETLNNQDIFNRHQAKKLKNQQAQIIDKEDDSLIDLNFEEDEVKKGIIYSEILKRPYN